MTTSHYDTSRLPAYLRQTEPLDLEALPLQVALLTMEAAELRLRLMAAMELLHAVVATLTLPDDQFGGTL